MSTEPDRYPPLTPDDLIREARRNVCTDRQQFQQQRESQSQQSSTGDSGCAGVMQTIVGIIVILLLAYFCCHIFSSM